ncbi:MAG TPA: class I SAM-dependent methyltransferase [Stellaceae bacterium]|nr:class I SAM-dependent methyltransferase [Stellaceae bacterium]
MPSLDPHATYWSQRYDWSSRGEEWSATWGGSEAQWFGAIYPRLHRFLPAHAIVEIGPGYGRWTKFLLPLCAHYTGVDISEKCIDACTLSFSTATHAAFILNDGVSLDSVPDGSIDLVFSFDSLVHAELQVLAGYTSHILSKLTATGVAFLHHSNAASVGELGWEHGRGLSVSNENVAELVSQSGGKILIQEIINWGGGAMLDCLTLFCQERAYAEFASIKLNNPHFMDEAALISQYQSYYSKLGRLND